MARMRNLGRVASCTVLACAAACGSSTSAADADDAGFDTTRADTATGDDASRADAPGDRRSDDGSTASDTAVGDATSEGGPDTMPSDGASVTDLDLDGLDDAAENAWATAYLPYISIHPSDGCPTHGIVVRVAPHPTEPKRVALWYDILYDQDCGASGHVGDDEMFGVVIDPSKPAPAGILAERAISHQGTACEHTSTCGRCTGLTACTTAKRLGLDYPTLFPSKDKHGNYVDTASCSASFICDFGGCTLSTAADAPPIVNVGEPLHPFVHDLTTEGFITTTNGWKNAALMHFDPWKPGNFGGAGDVSKDLVDPAFVVDTTACP